MRIEPYKAKHRAVQQRLYTEGPELPPRLVNRAHLPWLGSYTTQMQTEGKALFVFATRSTKVETLLFLIILRRTIQLEENRK